MKQFKSTFVNSCINLKEMKWNENESETKEHTRRIYCEAIQDKEEKLMATMR